MVFHLLLWGLFLLLTPFSLEGLKEIHAMDAPSKSKRPRLPKEWMPQKKDPDKPLHVYDFPIMCGTERRGYAYGEVPENIFQQGLNLVEEEINNDLIRNKIETSLHKTPLKKLHILFSQNILRDDYHVEVMSYDKTYYCLAPGLKSYFENLWRQQLLGPLKEVLDANKDMGQTIGGFGNIMYQPSSIMNVLFDSITPDTSILEIGSARGIQTFQMLQRGAKVTAVDLSKHDLKVLERHIPNHLKKNIKTLVAKFPHAPALTSLDWDEKFDVVLISHVAHYLTGPEFRDGIKQIFSWLKPGGTLYFQSLTPYSNPYKWRLFKSDQLQDEGFEWPGYFTMEEKAEESRLRPDHVKMAAKEMMPNYGHPIHPSILEREFNLIGFEIVYLNYGSFETKVIDKIYPLSYQELEKFVKQLVKPINKKQHVHIRKKLNVIPDLLTLAQQDALTYKNAFVNPDAPYSPLRSMETVLAVARKPALKNPIDAKIAGS